jgi:hypothetical protein
MTTFEEKYRKKTPGAEPGAPVATPAMENPKAAASATKEEYKAYDVAPHPRFNMWIRTNAANKDTDTSIPYSRMNHMITDGNGFVISLHYDTPIISVTLQGRNLGELHVKLLEHEVHWVMEFDPRKWAAPPEDAPCITGIEIKRKPLPEQKDDDGLSGEKQTSAKAATH